MDCSPPGFSVHGILQVRILEWVAISFSRGSAIFPTQGSNPDLPHCRQILYHLSHPGSPFSHCASSDFSQYPEQPEDFLLPPPPPFGGSLSYRKWCHRDYEKSICLEWSQPSPPATHMPPPSLHTHPTDWKQIQPTHFFYWWPLRKSWFRASFLAIFKKVVNRWPDFISNNWRAWITWWLGGGPSIVWAQLLSGQPRFPGGIPGQLVPPRAGQA